MRSVTKQKNMEELAEYQRYLYLHPRLRFLFFELTDQCNLNCLHCGSKCTAKNSNFLPLAEIEQTLKSVSEKYDPGNIMVCLTGGEPFLHPDLFQIVSMAHTMGFPVGITSNGTLIDSRKALALLTAGLDTITISIDGVGSTHDEFRGLRGSFDKATEGIHALREAGLQPEVLTVVHRKNLSKLEEIYRFVQKEGIFFWRLTNIDPIGRAGVNKELLLSGPDLLRLYEFIREKRFHSDSEIEITYGCAHFLGLDYENEVRDFYFQCGAGLFIASVMANGDIGACLDIERRSDLTQGNIFKDDFIDVWENRFEVFRKDRTMGSRICMGCPHREICMGDSAHTWDFSQKEPKYCVTRMMHGAGR